ncbi:65-kDa microtubule-associated protein 3 isoform X2 [Euphorbia lathyris]|uniref:65-kDa microtubule-associated protein 3 isoform X2 n=1 Tax=Euphorbia lathyris TaxID=212925 RepID=UPI0033135420
MYNDQVDRITSVETTCGLLLLELQKIWDDVGENDVRRDEMLLEIEQECLEVYKRKVNKANERRSELQREIVSIEAEIEGICSELGEPSLKYEKKNATVCLKEKTEIIRPLLVEMRKRKAERKKQFLEIVNELRSTSNEIFGPTEDSLNEVLDDLSLKRLEELQNQLRELKAEKSKRLNQVMGLVDNMNSLCLVLGLDFNDLIQKIHPTFDETGGFKQSTDDAIMILLTTIEGLRDIKIQRIQRLRDLGTVLLNLWNLMEIPTEEQEIYWTLTSNINASEPEIIEPDMLSMDFIKHVEDEVLRLEELKSGKVKDLILKKRLELEEICRSAHIVPASSAADYSVEGEMDPMHVLEEIDLAIANVKEQAWSRKEILDKFEKWCAACEEESWLEEYNRDENRYNAGRGAHLTLKRAEKARTVINKIPAMVEILTSKIMAWENERGLQFLYDSERLLFRMEQYNNLRKEKEQEKIRQRDQKKLQLQLIAEQEVRFGAKPSPSRSGRKGCRTSAAVASDRKLSLGGSMLQNIKADKKVSAGFYPVKKVDFVNQNSILDSQQYGGFTSQSSGRRNSEISDHFVKKQQVSTSRLTRKPLSPIPLSMSSEANIEKFAEDQKGKRNETSQTLMKTPTKPISGKDKENITPKKLPIEVPITPKTSTLPPMLMALTPATPYRYSSSKKAKSLLLQNVEYSFEEVRAGFLCPEPQLV